MDKTDDKADIARANAKDPSPTMLWLAAAIGLVGVVAGAIYLFQP